LTKISSSRTSPDAAAEADAALDEAVDEELEPQAASTPVQQAPAISRQKFLREIFISVFPPVVSKNVSYNEKGAPRLPRGAPIGYHSLSCLTSDEIGMVFHNKSL